jgi:hypothetical protein
MLLKFYINRLIGYLCLFHVFHKISDLFNFQCSWKPLRRPQAGLLELEQLCSKQQEALAAAVAETGESQFHFAEARADAHAAAT